MNKLQAAEQLRRALQMFAATLSDEQAMEVAAVYDKWQPDKQYAQGMYLTYGENGVGDPQLYQVLQDHTSSAEWMPDTATSLYKAIGVTSEGYPEWVQPIGASDAYNTGDIVSYNGSLYQSTIDGNVWAPDAYPAVWKGVSG